jgi:hypothetical protein
MSISLEIVILPNSEKYTSDPLWTKFISLHSKIESSEDCIEMLMHQ